MSSTMSVSMRLAVSLNEKDNQLSVDQLVSYLTDIRMFCPTEEEYKKLCLLLTSARLQDHSEYRNWNPSNGRVQCFKEVYPLISKFLQVDKTTTSLSQNDRLFQLIIKGLLYESCVEYCQARATASQENYNLNDPTILLMQTQLSETDASLLSWLHALPIETFSCPFEEKSLKINLDRFINGTMVQSIFKWYNQFSKYENFFNEQGICINYSPFIRFYLNINMNQNF